MAPIITVEHLTKRYRKSAIPAVDDVSFDVQPGELFAFLGPNGAGKTTTVSILTTTLAKTSGTVTIAGHDLDRESTSATPDLAAQERPADRLDCGRRPVRSELIVQAILRR